MIWNVYVSQKDGVVIHPSLELLAKDGIVAESWKKAMGLLKGIPSNISPELLYVLAKMGHGDEIVLGDANFPSRLVHLPKAQNKTP